MKKKSIYLVLLVMLVATALTSYYYNRNYIFFNRNQEILENKYTESKPKATKSIELKKPVPTKLIIPKIRFNQSLTYAKGDNKSQEQALKNGAVHYGKTPLPGQKGNVIIGGHYVSYVFKNLNKLKAGDSVELKAGSLTFKYKVIETKNIKEDKLKEVMAYGEGKERLLTLYTCVYPSRVTKKRFLVIAKQISP